MVESQFEHPRALVERQRREKAQKDLAEFKMKAELERKLIPKPSPIPIQTKGKFKSSKKKAKALTFKQIKKLQRIKSLSTGKREKGTRNILTQLGIIQEKKIKRRLTPTQQLQLKRLRQLKGMQRGSNLNNRQAVQQHQLAKLQQLQQAKVRNAQQSQSLRYHLEQLKNIQNKSRLQDMAKTRQLREARILESSMNPFHAHQNMNKVDLDFTGVSGENILLVRNVFKEDLSNNIMRNERPSILDTKSAGNNLFF